MHTEQPQKIACQQVLVEDNSVFSIQWTDLPPDLITDLTAARVLDYYLAAIKRLTFGLVRPASNTEGVSFLLLGRIPLLSFLPAAASVTEEGQGLSLRICGGQLVQQAQCDRGELSILLQSLPDGGLRVTLRLSDYCPLLLGSQRPSIIRRWLYRLTQAALHRLVTIRFLALLYRELGGTARSIKTIQVQVREGQLT
jgi:hypothetical protein